MATEFHLVDFAYCLTKSIFLFICIKFCYRVKWTSSKTRNGLSSFILLPC